MAPSTLDKNFRLSPQVRPVRYDATLKVDLSAKRFSGEGVIELSLEQPTAELLLHGIELEVELGKVRFEALDGATARTPSAIEVSASSETLRFVFPQPLPAGQAKLQLSWQGAFCPGLRGLYGSGGVAVTQFEAADARRVFPCFDEPAFKARWKLSLEVPKEAVALANGAPLSEELRGDWKLVRFEETEVLSSYLVAFSVGRFQGSAPASAGGIPVRAWSTPDKAHLTAFSQEVACAVLPRLQTYFGVPYAFGKVDQLGVPNFEAGAMENAGLITYRETLLLLDPKTAPLSVQKRAAEVITHELAHQWFGNWVTMVWWDDLWLNEAFATWMAYKIVADWRPEWRLWQDFDKGKASALLLDGLQSTHPIRTDVHNAHEATENFDLITYEKGGSVLRMIESYLGEGPFREGIRRYMKSFARANAVADDLWAALGEASKQPVVELANVWIRQPGYPLVSLSTSGREVKLRQERFYSAAGQRGDERWPVPVILRFQDAGGVKEHRVLLRDREATVTVPGSGELLWVCGNAGSTGFYRVDYTPEGRARLTRNLSALEVSERIGLLNDAWALFRAERLSAEALLELVAGYGQETEYAVLDELVLRLSAIEYRLLAEADRPAFRRFVEGLLSPQLQTLGLEAKPGEPDAVRLRRAALVKGLGTVARQPSLTLEAARRMDAILGGKKDALDANLHDTAAVLAARVGDAARFERFLAAYQAETDPAFKRRYLMALADFEDPALVARAQTLLFGDTVPTQDVAGFVTTLMANPKAQGPLWASLREDFDRVLAKASGAPMILRRVVEALGRLRERAELDELRALFERHPLPEQRSAIAQTLERLEQDVGMRERAMKPLGRWLAERGPRT